MAQLDPAGIFVEVDVHWFGSLEVEYRAGR